MKKAFTAAVVGVLALGAAVPAFSQEKPTGFDARIGLYGPTDQNFKDVNDAWVAFGADYRLTHRGGFAIAASFDYAGKGEDRLVPITLNLILRRHKAYAFAGAGIGFIKDNGNDLTSLAYEAGIGWDFTTGPDSVFIEAKYLGSSDANVNGVGVYLGVRF
jgi:hypothetical protein